MLLWSMLEQGQSHLVEGSQQLIWRSFGLASFPGRGLSTVSLLSGGSGWLGLVANVFLEKQKGIRRHLMAQDIEFT